MPDTPYSKLVDLYQELRQALITKEYVFPTTIEWGATEYNRYVRVFLSKEEGELAVERLSKAIVVLLPPSPCGVVMPDGRIISKDDNGLLKIKEI